MTWDPYQFHFTFCPNISILDTSTANPYLGLANNVSYTNITTSQFPPVKLKGPPCINVWTNFTMDTIPFSEYLACVPINVSYGEHIFYSNFDSSQSVMCLAPDIFYIRISLQDDYGNVLQYPEELDWQVDLAIQSAMPEGFVPLEI